MSLPFMWIDAFTTKKHSGNPCSVVFDASGLSTDDMLKMAQEFNLSETAFVTKVEGDQITARYFTPAEEIPMAGHPTVSTIHALRTSDRIDKNVTKLKLHLPAGIFDIEIEQNGAVVMQQNAPKFMRTYESKVIASAFSLNNNDILSDMDIQTVSTGTPQLMVPVTNLDALKRATMKVEEYKAIKKEGDFFSPHLFCLDGISNEASTFARHFGVLPDTFEDAFTGSASGGMAAYIWKNNLISESCFIAEQGHWMGRAGRAQLSLVGTPTDIHGIKISGQAVTVMDGVVHI